LRAKQDAYGRVFRILAVDGDTQLGGDDVDVALAGWLAERLGAAKDAASFAALRRLAERAKVELTDREETSVVVSGTSQPVTRAVLEERSAALRKKACDVAARAVRDVAGLEWGQLDEVILVGGQVLMPAVQRDVAALARKAPRVLRQPQLAVALGAARYAHFLSLGSECHHENALVNVLALDLGIRLEEDGFERLVPAGSTLPYASKPREVTTTRDRQETVRVDVLQGPRGARRAGECVVLGGLEVRAAPAPAGQPRFEVSLEVAHDSTVRVKVRDVSGRAPAQTKDVTGARLAMLQG
jgi:molecular chaperone DnaK (HSP70)